MGTRWCPILDDRNAPNEDSGDVFTNPDEIHDSESSPVGLLTDSALDAGRANIWTLCNDSPTPDFYCDTTLQMLNQEQWAADVHGRRRRIQRLLDQRRRPR